MGVGYGATETGEGEEARKHDGDSVDRMTAFSRTSQWRLLIDRRLLRHFVWLDDWHLAGGRRRHGNLFITGIWRFKNAIAGIEISVNEREGLLLDWSLCVG